MGAAMRMIYHGDLFYVLPTLESDSIEACVTDPPYGLEFMGKKWDCLQRYNEMQAWHQKWAREVYRVLKLGAY